MRSPLSSVVSGWRERHCPPSSLLLFAFCLLPFAFFMPAALFSFIILSPPETSRARLANRARAPRHQTRNNERPPNPTSEPTRRTSRRALGGAARGLRAPANGRELPHANIARL